MDYAAAAFMTADHLPPVLSLNADGSSPFVLVCDHASNRIPGAYGTLGLGACERMMHIAWDPGALALARQMSALLDAPLIHSTVSRLIIDCNRDISASDLITTLSENTEVAANRDLPGSEREARIVRYHAPYHYAIEALLEERRAAGSETILVAVHSFTPVYHGVRRPWPIGLIHGQGPAFTEALADALSDAEPELDVGWNEPYAARNGVTYTLEHHGDRRHLPATMIELRHDEILTPDGVARWAGRLVRALVAARAATTRNQPRGQNRFTAAGGRNG